MNLKKPKSGGIKRARESFGMFIKPEPSETLIKLIEDVLVENEKTSRKLGAVVYADKVESTANNRTCKNSNSTVKYRTDRLME